MYDLGRPPSHVAAAPRPSWQPRGGQDTTPPQTASHRPSGRPLRRPLSTWSPWIRACVVGCRGIVACLIHPRRLEWAGIRNPEGKGCETLLPGLLSASGALHKVRRQAKHHDEVANRVDSGASRQGPARASWPCRKTPKYSVYIVACARRPGGGIERSRCA